MWLRRKLRSGKWATVLFRKRNKKVWLAKLGKQEEKNDRGQGGDNNIGRVSSHPKLQTEKAVSIGWG